jgi:glyoxylase-like metal-dependent hydrolase (beta-lactamase superfamily II)
MMEIRRLVNQPAASNGYVLFDKTSGDDALLVDPGAEDSTEWFTLLHQEQLQPHHIILTHEHYDHCWGIIALRQAFPSVKVVCSASCSIAIQDRKKNHSAFFYRPGFELPPAEILLDEKDWTFEWHGQRLKFWPAQGHTASGIIFTLGNFVFTGDELMKDAKTVTKLKTGSPDKLLDSLHLLEGLQNRGLTVCPGHGEMFPLDGYDLNKAK